MNEKTEYTVHGSIAVITLQNPPVNALGVKLRTAIFNGLEMAISTDSITAIVVHGSGRCFSGGADIREFGSPPISPNLGELIDLIENCPIPVIAAIRGVCYGGGMELALACHYRVGDSSALIAQPEIKLGLVPGAGATQRLPRVAGVEAALKIILSGNPIDAATAVSMGALDKVFGGDLVESATAFAREIAGDGTAHRVTRKLDVEPPPDGFFDAERNKLERRGRGLIAPWRCIDSVENAVRLPVDEGLKAERKFFEECMASYQSKAQRHVFFAERQVAKIPDIAKDTPVKSIQSVAIVGCGTMGGGIGMNFANAGIRVHFIETSGAGLDRGLGIIRDNYAATVAKGRLSESAMQSRMELLTGGTDFEAAVNADMVIEAAFEKMSLKKEIFQKLDAICPPGAILATNTSTLDIDQIAAITSRPEMVLGTHFFSPANVMRLLEIVRGKKTSKEVVATVMGLAKTIGKVGVLVGVCDGFVGNRMFHAYTRQASFLLEEGALPQDVDRVLYDLGFAMGPFAVLDLAGLDIGWAVRKEQAATRPAGQRYSPIADRICEMGRFGQKTGAGWYQYEAGARAPIPDPEIASLIAGVSGELGIERRELSDQEIHDRCIYSLVNEGARILEEGLALRASDIDIVWINGYGFPLHRGGPMFYADTVGLDKVCESLNHLHEKHGDMFKPSALLERLAAEGKTFQDHDKLAAR